MKRNYVSALIAAASMAVVAGNALADDVKSDQPVKDSYITTKVKERAFALYNQLRGAS